MKVLLIQLLVLGFLGAACTPSYLRKYTKRSENASGPGADVQTNKTKKRSLFGSKAKKTKPTPSVYAIDDQTYRFKADKGDLWDSLLSVLLKNYNLNIVDRSSGVITTEWDKFVLNDNYYRNKLSIRVQPISHNLSQITVHNAVEQLQRSEVGSGFTNLWLPVKDEAQETSRIIQNVSVVMNFQPPANVRSNVARKTN